MKASRQFIIDKIKQLNAEKEAHKITRRALKKSPKISGDVSVRWFNNNDFVMRKIRHKLRLWHLALAYWDKRPLDSQEQSFSERLNKYNFAGIRGELFRIIRDVHDVAKKNHEKEILPYTDDAISNWLGVLKHDLKKFENILIVVQMEDGTKKTSEFSTIPAALVFLSTLTPDTPFKAYTTLAHRSLRLQTFLKNTMWENQHKK